MLMPLADLRDNDRYGFVKVRPLWYTDLDVHGKPQAWEDGGYSDDLIVASTCSQHGLTILCPSFAVFPQRWACDAWCFSSRVICMVLCSRTCVCLECVLHRVQPDCSAAAYINYLHRQLYVMDTYATQHNRAINHTMAAIHCYLSAAFVTAIVAGDYLALEQLPSMRRHDNTHVLIFTAPYSYTLTLTFTTTFPGIWQLVCHALDATTPGFPLPAACLATSLLAAQGGLYWMTARLCALWAVMLPHTPADVRQFDWCKVRRLCAQTFLA